MVAMLKYVLLMGGAWNGGWWVRWVILRDGGRADGEVVRGSVVVEGRGVCGGWRGGGGKGVEWG